jgi:hypothetical protein
MENEHNLPDKGDTSTVYVIGAIVVVAVIIAAILLWPKKPEVATPTPQPEVTQPAVEEKTNFTKLTCEKQWFNPVIGMPKYYLSVEGGDINSVNATECTFTLTNKEKVVVTERTNAVFKPAPERGGSSFMCTTKAVELPKGTGPMTMTVVVKNDQGQTATCPAGALNL